ncbi:MAG: DUF5916 domain-containing protein [Gemmatimonadaceae bacterium]
MVAAVMLVFSLLLVLPMRAQTMPVSTPADTVRTAAVAASRAVGALRISHTISIDGALDEQPWREAEAAGDFVQQRPTPGAPASQSSEVRVLYTDEALYVGATLLDSAPDSIVAQLGRRDTELVADWFWVQVDSRDDNRSAFVFGVNAAGVIRDYMRVDDTGTHADWDAVWHGVARVGRDGWSVEMRIPLSQLRFSTGDRSWGVNFAREIARREEISYWAPIAPTASGFVSLFGELRGLRDLEPARQIELRPYVVARVTQAPGERANPFYEPYDAFSSLGGDITIGLTSGVTLTATLNPDFGQVEADPAQINLTDQELWLPEQRPFFLDGAELFDTGHPQLFYSRRIGRAPQAALPGEAVYAERPDAATILGAVKVAGTTAGGWSIGMLDAVTARETVALVTADGVGGEAIVEPMTNYSVARLAREFREGKSGLGVIATTVHRDLDREPGLQFLTSRAFSGGIDGHHRFGKGDLELSASLRASHISGSANALTRVQRNSIHRFQRPDADHLELDSTRTALSGARAEVNFTKIGGGNWRWELGGYVATPGFEVNDLGFAGASDRGVGWGTFGYSRFAPGRIFRRWDLSGFANTSRTTGNEPLGSYFDLTLDAQFANYWTVYAWVDYETAAFSTEALRGGPALRRPGAWWYSLSLTGDRRKPLVLGASIMHRAEDETDGAWTFVSSSVTIRPSSRMDLTLRPRMEWNREAAQFVSSHMIDDSTHYVFAPLKQRTASLTARLNYAVSPRLSLQVYAQPFVSAGDYRGFTVVRDPHARRERERFGALQSDRVQESRGPGGGRRYALDLNDDAAFDLELSDPDFNSRQFRSNVVMRWEFRPGSTLFVAWSQSRDSFDPDGSFELGRDMGALFGGPGTNAVMVKLSYWLGL